MYNSCSLFLGSSMVQSTCFTSSWQVPFQIGSTHSWGYCYSTCFTNSQNSFLHPWSSWKNLTILQRAPYIVNSQLLLMDLSQSVVTDRVIDSFRCSLGLWIIKQELNRGMFKSREFWLAIIIFSPSFLDCLQSASLFISLIFQLDGSGLWLFSYWISAGIYHGSSSTRCKSIWIW